MPQNSTLNSVIQPRAVCVYSSIQFSKEINTFCKNTLNSLNVTVSFLHDYKKKDTEDWSNDAEYSALHHRNITFLYKEEVCELQPFK